MADKHTKRELFENLLVFTSAAGADEWVLDGLRHELNLLDKRSANKSPNAKVVAEQRANMAMVREVLTSTPEPMRATAIANSTGFTVQRVTALLRKMVDANEVTRTEDKKVATFSLT